MTANCQLSNCQLPTIKLPTAKLDLGYIPEVEFKRLHELSEETIRLISGFMKVPERYQPMTEQPSTANCQLSNCQLPTINCQLERLFEEHDFDYVYHLAAEYGRWNGEDYYENLWLTNVVGTKNVIRLQEKKRFRMVFFSSAEVYGDFEGTMSEEVMDTVPIKQINDYAMTKWVGEMQILNSAEMFGTQTLRVRLVNAYGPHEHYSPYRGVVPMFIYRASS